jgi:hypothetical protein
MKPDAALRAASDFIFGRARLPPSPLQDEDLLSESFASLERSIPLDRSSRL